MVTLQQECIAIHTCFVLQLSNRQNPYEDQYLHDQLRIHGFFSQSLPFAQTRNLCVLTDYKMWLTNRRTHISKILILWKSSLRWMILSLCLPLQWAIIATSISRKKLKYTSVPYTSKIGCLGWQNLKLGQKLKHWYANAEYF